MPKWSLLGFWEPTFWDNWSNGQINIFNTRQNWAEIVPQFKYIFPVGSFSIHFWPFSIQPVVSMSVRTGDQILSLNFEKFFKYSVNIWLHRIAEKSP